MRWSNFTWLVKKGINSVWYNRLMSFATFCVLLVSLLMVGLASLTAVNINVILSYIEEQNEVLVYSEDPDIARITRTLQDNRNVTRVQFKSKEVAWAEYKQEHPDAQPIYEKMEFNPMPDTYIVTISDLTRIKTAVREFSEIEGVLKVTAPHDFAEFLIGVRNTLTVIGGAIILALIAVCLVIIYNSSRASVFARRQEINIMKYVGATNAFVRFPFFIEGMFVGVLAGIASWGLTGLAYNSIVAMFGADLTLWQALGLGNLIGFETITWIVLIANCAAGAILCATGIIMSMGKHLKV
jgi:cell division transport system permease protein